MHIIKIIPTLEDIKAITSARSILFDMDGTLVNTEPLHAKALLNTLQELSPKRNFIIEELHQMFHGQGDNDVYKALETELSVSFDDFLTIKNKYFIKSISESERILRPEITSLLEQLKKESYKIALVTASEKSAALCILEKENLKKYFDIILTREDSSETKPSPRPYLDAIEKLNIKKEDAFIFEDSETGIQAAIESKINYAVANWFI
ncbi:HAD family hydrolase [Halobacteriovorax sp.]|uniref:HAD family hydrolase n=1 Tax=Halobacteriovorax sp. TaxID=2020862 RepID=UPI003569C12F